MVDRYEAGNGCFEILSLKPRFFLSFSFIFAVFTSTNSLFIACTGTVDTIEILRY